MAAEPDGEMSVKGDEPSLAVTLPPQPRYLALARWVGRAFAEGLGVGEPKLADVQTVINEACALALTGDAGGEARPVRIEANRSGGHFSIIVRDRGQGLRRATAGNGDRQHLGLQLISGLSREFEIAEADNGGTELRMLLAL
jgi:anti-sigma regulatory factor (Ser/Thr protein kinase)